MPDLPENSSPSLMPALEQRAAEQQLKSDAASSRAGRTLDVLRYYSWVQIARRASNIVKRRFAPAKKIKPVPIGSTNLRHDESLQKLAQLIIDHRANHPSHVQVDLPSGRFVLLNHAVELGKNGLLDKQALNRQTHLWRFQFHYHEFLLTLAAAGQWQQADAFLNSWLDDFGRDEVLAKDDAWHPYCISRRVVAWAWLLCGGAEADKTRRLSPETTQRLIASAVQQCEHLHANLELDLGGNHLLENVTALAIAGSVLECDSASVWRDTAARVLKQQLPRQVLAHGEHFELSPIYHGHILGNLLRIETCSRQTSQLGKIVHPFINPMLKHLGLLTHPDGELPLFADSVFAESPSVSELLSCAQLNGREFPDLSASDGEQGGYRILQNDKTFAICDFGPIAAANLPAHGHCDALNLEVSVAGQRWIIDSGNYNYSDDSMRHYCRSSIAHNVVTANDQNQATTWDKFRMGSRPSVGSIQQGTDEHWQWATASHDGYQRVGVERLQRIVAISEAGLACFDKAFDNDKRYSGPLIGYLHFHPEVEVVLKRAEPANQVFKFEISRHGTTRCLTICAREAKIEQGWYCPEFGKRLVSPVIRYDVNKTENFLGWVLHDQHISCEIVDSQHDLLITMGGNTPFRWSFSRSTPIYS